LSVKPKKHLGQHFLRDLAIAEDITLALKPATPTTPILEIGPGMGVLTDFLIKRNHPLTIIDVDKESIQYLNNRYKNADINIIEGDFLAIDWAGKFDQPFAIIGNFPYNISSQIFFKVLDHRDLVNEVVCMLQKEVALRLAVPIGHRDGGILSIFLQSFYNVEYLFTVDEHVFEPPPKVKSGVIRITRNETTDLGCNEVLFKQVVKTAFGMRRKTLRNALKVYQLDEKTLDANLLDKRAEQLKLQDFINLTNVITEMRRVEREK
jgi:16S rRNA (adenine1518-N6/adenine1519-N6)-dimethyltransferase